MRQVNTPKKARRWHVANLITVDRYRNRETGFFDYTLSTVERENMPEQSERVYVYEYTKPTNEPYKLKIRELLDAGEVVVLYVESYRGR